MSLVQCRQVQFNSDPEVKHFDAEGEQQQQQQQEHELLPQPEQQQHPEQPQQQPRSRKPSMGGLGPLFQFAAQFGIEVEDDDGDVEELVSKAFLVCQFPTKASFSP